MNLRRFEEPGQRKALAFTILVHAGLIAALFLGVQWKRSQPDVVGGRNTVTLRPAAQQKFYRLHRF